MKLLTRIPLSSPNTLRWLLISLIRRETETLTILYINKLSGVPFCVRPWSSLNAMGRLILTMCVFNVCLSVFFALQLFVAGSLFSLIVGMFCGIGTYDPRYNRE